MVVSRLVGVVKNLGWGSAQNFGPDREIAQGLFGHTKHGITFERREWKMRTPCHRVGNTRWNSMVWCHPMHCVSSQSYIESRVFFLRSNFAKTQFLYKSDPKNTNPIGKNIFNKNRNSLTKHRRGVSRPRLDSNRPGKKVWQNFLFLYKIFFFYHNRNFCGGRTFFTHKTWNNFWTVRVKITRTMTSGAPYVILGGSSKVRPP